MTIDYPQLSMRIIINGRERERRIEKQCSWNFRIIDDLKMNSTMSMNVPTSREYGRFTLMTSKYSSSTVTTPREKIFDSERLINNTASDECHRREYSPRSLTDYINQDPSLTHSYIPPSNQTMFIDLLMSIRDF